MIYTEHKVDDSPECKWVDKPQKASEIMNLDWKLDGDDKPQKANKIVNL